MNKIDIEIIQEIRHTQRKILEETHNNPRKGEYTKDGNYSTQITTVLVLFNLTKFAGALRLRCGTWKCFFLHHYIFCVLNLRTLYNVWSLVRRRFTRSSRCQHIATLRLKMLERCSVFPGVSFQTLLISVLMHAYVFVFTLRLVLRFCTPLEFRGDNKFKVEL